MPIDSANGKLHNSYLCLAMDSNEVTLLVSRYPGA